MDHSCFEMLAPAVQRFIYKKGFAELNSLQRKSLLPVLQHRQDVVISAATASGKTEAAFFPALTYILNNFKKGFRILYIGPIKALINDQARRLEEMTQFCTEPVPVTPWHGDVDAGKKYRQFRKPSGIVLITPESLESLLMNRRDFMQRAVEGLEYIVIDEFHAFMGSQRGYQLQSQLHRLDNLKGKIIPRIALSATFSNITSVQTYLRPNSMQPCLMITAEDTGSNQLALQLRGYRLYQPSDPTVSVLPEGYQAVSADIFRQLRGSNNLVFANTRAMTELIASMLTLRSQKMHVPNEFFPHHGSLAKELRESLEQRLQQGRLPTTAICTSTLELGIDISEVDSVGQIEPPTSVASLRQRLGRSGRRTHRAVLRLYTGEMQASQDFVPRLKSQLCEDTFQTAAMVNLMLKRWYEPPLTHEYSFSVLMQQTLSVIASHGSVSALRLWELLCKTGPFFMTTQQLYKQLLLDMRDADFITQVADGTLTLGLKGEQLCQDWDFYAVFKTTDEYTIEKDGQKIGTIPLGRPLEEKETFVFAGKAWEVSFISESRKIIGVKPFHGMATPLSCGEAFGTVHDAVRQEMFRLYCSRNCPPYLNSQAKANFDSGAELFHKLKLQERNFIDLPQSLCLFPWTGSKTMFTIVTMLRDRAIRAEMHGAHIELEYCSRDNLAVAVAAMIRDADKTEPQKLALHIRHKDENKFDAYLDEQLLSLGFAQSHLDVAGAMAFFRKLSHQL